MYNGTILSVLKVIRKKGIFVSSYLLAFYTLLLDQASLRFLQVCISQNFNLAAGILLFYGRLVLTSRWFLMLLNMSEPDG